jgi:AGCS family alanine or glycine:cation symporter
LLLSPKALRALRDYEKSKKQGDEPKFDPKKLDIEGAGFWESTIPGTDNAEPVS